MAKANNGFIVVLVTGAILINVGVVFAVKLIARGIGFRTKLHHPKRYGCSRKHVAHALCTDNRLYILNKIIISFCLCRRIQGGTAEKYGQYFLHWMFVGQLIAKYN